MPARVKISKYSIKYIRANMFRASHMAKGYNSPSITHHFLENYLKQR